MPSFASPLSTAVGDHLAWFGLRFSLTCQVLHRSARPQWETTVPETAFVSVFQTRFRSASLDRSRKPLCLIRLSSHVLIQTFALTRPTAAGSSLPGPTSLPAKGYGSSGSPDPVGRDASACFVGRFRHPSSKSETSRTWNNFRLSDRPLAPKDQPVSGNVSSPREKPISASLPAATVTAHAVNLLSHSKICI